MPKARSHQFTDEDRRPTARLRILETTDLHMHLLGYDYFSDLATAGLGLINLADKIEELRSDSQVTTLLFDNGDFLQGNPLADFLAETSGKETHPAIAAFNILGYDAGTLGNHEFDYGLAFLSKVLDQADFPVVCANIHAVSGDALVSPFAIFQREVRTNDGAVHPISIGVVGFVPPQVTDWTRSALAERFESEDIVPAAKRIVPEIKAAGADLIVALCHSGIGPTDDRRGLENAAVPLSSVESIDVILTGHTHDRFPSCTPTPGDAVNNALGRLNAKPAVMAGFGGECLGVIDLQICLNNDGWQITDHRCRLEPASTSAPIPSAIRQKLDHAIAPAHQRTLNYIRQPIAQTEVSISSFFSAFSPELPQQLLANAQASFLADELRNSAFAHVPILSATAPFRTGGSAGPSNYIDIRPGPFALRDAAAIYPFANTLCAVHRNGAQLIDWLERAASHFSQIQSGCHTQPLIKCQSPTYNFDTIYGLTYEFDLTKPARFDHEGTLFETGGNRVQNVCFEGNPVAEDDHFIVAANSYRTYGGGGYARIEERDVLFTSVVSARDMLTSYLTGLGTVSTAEQSPLSFVPIGDTTAQFYSAPIAKQRLGERMSFARAGPDGFELFNLAL